MDGPTPPPDRPFGKPNILTSSQKEKRKQDTEAERDAKQLHDYVVGNLVRRREWVGHRDREVEWAEEESRRYNLLLVQVRQANPTWTVEDVRRKALGVLRLEKGDRELRLSYVPKK